MLQANEKIVTGVTLTDAMTTKVTKDAGRVSVGAGMLRFADVAPKRDAAKDAGRVQIGAGMLRF